MSNIVELTFVRPPEPSQDPQEQQNLQLQQYHLMQEQRRLREQEKNERAKGKLIIKDVLIDSIQLLQCLDTYINVIDGTTKKHYVSKAALTPKIQLAYDRFVVSEMKLRKYSVPLTNSAISAIGKKWRETITNDEK